MAPSKEGLAKEILLAVNGVWLPLPVVNNEGQKVTTTSLPLLTQKFGGPFVGDVLHCVLSSVVAEAEFPGMWGCSCSP
jgi:hypothetical protein